MSAQSRYFTTTMRCASCLAKLQPILDGNQEILDWKADLDDSRKLLQVEMTERINSSELIQLIAQAGFEAKELNLDQVNVSDGSSQDGFRLSNYWPLFLVISYVIGMASFAEWIQAGFEWSRWMSYFMGFFFLGFAFFKLLDVPKFADAFSSYDVIAEKSRFYALMYPALEFGLGLLFVTQTWLMTANVLTAAVMAIGLIGVVRAVLSKKRIQCACLGTAFDLPMSVVTIVENSVMLVMAIVMMF